MSSLFAKRCTTLLAVCGIGIFAHPALAGSEAAGEHIRIVCDFDNDKYAADALATAEAGWAFAAERLGTSDVIPKAPCLIYLYLDRDAFIAVDKERNEGRSKDSFIFSDPKDKSAHIAIFPTMDVELTKKLGIGSTTRIWIADRAANLALATTTSADQKALPESFHYGFNNLCSAEVCVAKGWIPAVDKSPYYSTMNKSAEALRTADRLPSVHEIINERYKSLDHYNRFSVSWLFFHFMNDPSRREKLDEIIRHAAEAKGGKKGKKEFLDFAKKTLGGDEGLDKLDKAFVAFVKKSKPMWYEQFRNLDVRKGRWVQTADTEKQAYAWTNKNVGAKKYRITGSLTILPVHDRKEQNQMGFMLGGGGDGYIFVGFTGTWGVYAQRFYQKENRRENLRSEGTNDVDIGKKFDFEIKVNNDEMEVLINDESMLYCDLTDKDMTGLWGVSASPGCAGIWHDIKVLTPKKKKKGKAKD